MDAAADYVIVGAGSAGCVLADRLSADGTSQVILIEAGGPDSQAEISVPAAFPRLLGTRVDWAFTTTAQAGLGGRPVRFPRGKVLGGSSSLNAQIWTRGHRLDYDSWGPGWRFSDVRPYFQRAEDRSTGDRPTGDRSTGDRRTDDGSGTGGPVPVRDLRDPSPATVAFLAACAQAGHASVGAGESSADAGYGPVRVTQRGGRRCSAADAYLRPALSRPNLTVLAGRPVRRVVIESGRAVGVELATPGHPAGGALVRARREVILSAGAVGSAHLLLLSGVGDPEQLRSVGVPVRVPLPEVGRNLADHLYVPLVLGAREPVSPGVGDQRADAVEYLRTRRGRLSSNLAEALVFLRTDECLPAPDVELVWMVVPHLDQRGPSQGGPDQSGSDRPGHGVTLGVVLLQPASRGTVRLASADPAVPPRIDPGYLSDPADEPVLVAGVRRAQRLLGQPALAGLLGAPLLAGALDPSTVAIGGYLRAHADTLYHPVGTCRMGADPASVVDPQLRVRGVLGLRVVDASALPVIPRAHTHAPTVMLAERAADLIRLQPPLPKGRSPVAAHSGADPARSTFTELFRRVLADPSVVARLRERQLSLHLVQTDPAVELFVWADGVLSGTVPHPPTLRFESSTDTAHELWLGRLSIPRAAIARQLTIKGPVARIRQLTDLLPTIGATYAALLTEG